MQIPILNGIYKSNNGDVRVSYPVNLIPVPEKNGISLGYLKPADGIIMGVDLVGLDRGGINWNGELYRVSGEYLYKINEDWTVVNLGSVGFGGLVSFDYSFDRLAIASGGSLYYYSSSLGLIKVVDPDLGVALDVVWVDGYFMTTDGTNLVVTELTDPTQVNPLKYGSSEVDPDRIVALKKIRNEIYAINRYTIEVFDNVGGEVFPFQRVSGAQIQKGCVGTHSCCVFEDTVAFIGGARNEAPAIYLGVNSTTTKISSNEIDKLLMELTEDQLSECELESRSHESHRFLYVHLPDRTVVFDFNASKVFEENVWFTVTTSINGFSKYKAHGIVWCYNKWIVGDPNSGLVGYFNQNNSEHWNSTPVRWEFATTIVYGEATGAAFNQIELLHFNGNFDIDKNPAIATSYSVDGNSWSQDKTITTGTPGNTNKRLVWFRQGHMRNWRIQRFKGDSTSHLSFLRLEAQIEKLMR